MTDGSTLTESSEEQRERAIKDAAFEIFKERERDGSPGSQDEDWYLAEWEYGSEYDQDFRYWLRRIKGAFTYTENLNYAVPYCVAAEMRAGGGAPIHGDTLLPCDHRRLERICASVARLVKCQRFAAPENVHTVSDLFRELSRVPFAPRQGDNQAAGH
jgi:hypothetical protein